MPDRLTIGLCSFWLLLSSLPVVAQTLPEPSRQPLEIDLLQENSTAKRSDVLRGDRISDTKIQVPSLWWAKEQFDPFAGKLIDNWLIYPKKEGRERRVDILVNFQLWQLLDYIERYTLVNKFGTVARGYGYNIRIFNNQNELLAAYTCTLPIERARCNLWIDPSAQDSLRRRPKL
jgi:hypothetical protein